MTVLEVKGIKKVYGSRFGEAKTEALTEVNFSVNKGEFVAIMGESGSGKSTLLNIVATLDKPTSGTVLVNGKDISVIKDKDIAAFRRNELGFVFQDFNLLDTFSNRDNIYLPMVLAGKKPSEMDARLAEIQEALGLADFVDKFPYQVSGGQKQRIAIARAIITNPALLLADEPTGALDSKSSKRILSVFENLQAMGQTILMVTHSAYAAAHAGRVLFIKDGKVYHEIYRGDEGIHPYMERIAQSLAALNQGGQDHEE